MDHFSLQRNCLKNGPEALLQNLSVLLTVQPAACTTVCKFKPLLTSSIGRSPWTTCCEKRRCQGQCQMLPSPFWASTRSFRLLPEAHAVWRKSWIRRALFKTYSFVQISCQLLHQAQLTVRRQCGYFDRLRVNIRAWVFFCLSEKGNDTFICIQRHIWSFTKM